MSSPADAKARFLTYWNLLPFVDPGNLGGFGESAGGLAGHRQITIGTKRNWDAFVEDFVSLAAFVEATGQAALDGGGVVGSSSTSVDLDTAVGTSPTLTTESGKAWVAGMRVKGVSESDTDNFWLGEVQSYSGTSLVVAIDGVNGTGAHTDWVIFSMPSIVVPQIAAPSSALDIALTAASASIQRVTMTATGKAVSLPDATTLSDGQSFLIRNVGTNRFDLNDNSGAFLGALAEGGEAAFTVIDRGSAAGTWRVVDSGREGVRAEGATVVEAADSDNFDADLFPGTSIALVAYRETATPLIRAAAVDFSDPTTLSVGPPATMDNAALLGEVACVCLTSTLGLVAWHDETNDLVEVIAVSRSGTTLTPDTVATVEGIALSNGVRLVRVSDTAALVAWADATNTQDNVAHIDASTPGALSITNTINVAADATSLYGGFTALSATVFALHRGNDNVVTWITLSGTTPADDGDMTIVTAGASQGLVALDATYAVGVTSNSLFLARYNGTGDFENVWTADENLIFGVYALVKQSARRVVVFGAISSNTTSATIARVYERIGDTLVPRGEWTRVHGASLLPSGSEVEAAASAADTNGVSLLAFADPDNSSFATVRAVRGLAA